jgi:hypothetical protein
VRGRDRRSRPTQGHSGYSRPQNIVMGTAPRLRRCAMDQRCDRWDHHRRLAIAQSCLHGSGRLPLLSLPTRRSASDANRRREGDLQLLRRTGRSANSRSPFLAGEDAVGAPHAAILSYGLWEREFGRDQNCCAIRNPFSCDEQRASIQPWCCVPTERRRTAVRLAEEREPGVTSSLSPPRNVRKPMRITT